jgi:enoyl-CoA hydratase
MALIYEKEGHIAKVGLYRPEQKNALDPGILFELHGAWKDINEDSTIRVAVLYSALPEIFCAGMDLKSAVPILTRIREPETEAEKWLFDGFGSGVGQAMLKLSFVKKPVIAAIHGYCLTGGFEMVMGADLRVASLDAVFQMREASLGIMPFGGGNVFLPRIISSCRALEILLTADNYDAKTLYAWGFLNRVVPKEELMPTAMGLAEKIANNGPLATQGIIRCARAIRDMELNAAFMKEVEIGAPIFASEDAREGVRAQKEKRKPNFPGR